MKKLIKNIAILVSIFISFNFVACGEKKTVIAEKLTLAKTMIGEVEFQNGDGVKIEQEENKWIIDGKIEVMSDAQKAAFGSQDATHVFVVKLLFDKERTIDYLKIKGEITKVYSTDKNDEGYVDSISNILDNEDGEDAFVYLILSANTKSYGLDVKYTDGKSVELEIDVKAMLVTASDN